MRVELWWIGKTKDRYLLEGIELYRKRIKHYLPFEAVALPDIRKGGSLKPEELKKREGQLVLDKLQPGDLLVLLDEHGRTYTSVEFARYLDRMMQQSGRRLIFVIGGAFGFAPSLLERADQQLSLSRMTFSHQMVRLFFAEQLYRAMTILRNEPYHNP